MPALVKTIVLSTLKIFFAVIAFLVSALVANTFLSYILPRIFAEAPRQDKYEMPSLNTWVIALKHGVTLVVSVWAGISTGQSFLEPHRREGRPGATLESADKGGRPGATYMESEDREGRPFPSSWPKMQWSNGKGEGDRREEEGAEEGSPFEYHTALYSPSQTPSTPSVAPTIQDWAIYNEYFGETPPFALHAINNESDGLSQSLVDDAPEWNPELRQRLKEIPKQLHPPDQLTPLTPSEANHHKAWLIQQISSHPQLSYDETELGKCILLDPSRQFIPTSKAIEDEYQYLRYQISAQKPTTNVRVCRIFAFKEMVLFNTVKCWVWDNLHMVR